MSQVKYNISTRSLEDLLRSKAENRLTIPPHQRNAKVWNEKTRKNLIDTIKNGYPIPSINIHEETSGIGSIEDGLQRLTTMEMFKAGEFPDSSGKHYPDWSEIDQYKFLNYQIPVLTFRNAELSERIEIFDRFQNGCPLRAGERINSLSYTPLVKYAIDILRTPGKGLHDRASLIWGPMKTGDKDKRYNDLLATVALVNGAAHGFRDSSGGVTKNYENLRCNLQIPVQTEQATRCLEELLSIYEDASKKRPVEGKSNLSTQRNAGNFSGYILYSLKECPDAWKRLHDRWVDFIVKYRENNNILYSILHRGLTASRNWNVTRWKTGCHNLFPEIRAFDIDERSVPLPEYDDSSSDESDD